MTPKEKAKELVDRFKQYSSGNVGGDSEKYTAKQCALICVEEMIKVQSPWVNSFMGRKQFEELEEIKQEINKL